MPQPNHGGLKRQRLAWIAATALLLLLSLFGCGKKLTSVLGPNRPPEVQIAAFPTSSPRDRSLRFEVRWKGSDPDGRVDHYVYAVDPLSVDRVDATWVRTDESRCVVSFPASTAPESPGASERSLHVVAVRAIDDNGASSGSATVPLADGNIPPTVTITNPTPSSQLEPIVPGKLRITWQGLDPDGLGTTRPVSYKYILLGPGSVFPISVAVAFPDSLRRFYAPDFPGWGSTGQDSTSVVFTNLVPNQEYLFAVTGFDQAGDYDPVFSLNKNMLRFRVGFTKVLGPRLTLFGSGFDYTYLTTGYADDPSRYVPAWAPANVPVTFNWFGVPTPGADLAGYRWALDPHDINDESPRAGPEDVQHWSELGPGTSVTLGPFVTAPHGASHLLYIEARDSFGSRSLGIINFTVAAPTFNSQLLIVTDMRLKGDNILPGQTCTRAPLGPWPTRAELDTFLFARGGVPWMCYPAGTLSTPGIFAEYAHDTLGTRTGMADLTVPLSVLRKYRHVIWLTDGTSANYGRPGTDATQPMTSLRYMTQSGKVNTLASYVALGGQLWVAGGGGGFASTIMWNDVSNDRPTVTFSSSSPRRELTSGRFMYDVFHWQSEFRASVEPVDLRRFAGRFGDSGPPYGSLPPLLEKKTFESDPLPPNRSSSFDFYQETTSLEYLQVGNSIIETVPGETDPVSTLDTLYEAPYGGGLPPPQQNPHNVVMTNYHGPAAPQGVLFSGFNLWYFKRAQCQALVDFVLQQMWGLTPSAVTGAAPKGPGGRTILPESVRAARDRSR